MLDRFAAPKATQDVVFLALTVGRDDHPDRSADRLLCREAEQPLGRWIPCGDDPVEVLADDRLIGPADDGGEPQRGFLGSLLVGGVLEQNGEPVRGREHASSEPAPVRPVQRLEHDGRGLDRRAPQPGLDVGPDDIGEQLPDRLADHRRRVAEQHGATVVHVAVPPVSIEDDEPLVDAVEQALEAAAAAVHRPAERADQRADPDEEQKTDDVGEAPDLEAVRRRQPEILDDRGPEHGRQEARPEPACPCAENHGGYERQEGQILAPDR